MGTRRVTLLCCFYLCAKLSYFSEGFSYSDVIVVSSYLTDLKISLHYLTLEMYLLDARCTVQQRRRQDTAAKAKAIYLIHLEQYVMKEERYYRYAAFSELCSQMQLKEMIFFHRHHNKKPRKPAAELNVLWVGP